MPAILSPAFLVPIAALVCAVLSLFVALDGAERAWRRQEPENEED